MGGFSESGLPADDQSRSSLPFLSPQGAGTCGLAHAVNRKISCMILARKKAPRLFDSMTTHPDMSATLSGVEEQQPDHDPCPMTSEDLAEVLIRCTTLPDQAAAGALLTSGVDPNLLSGDGRTAFCELLDRMDAWSDAKPDVARPGQQRVSPWDRALDIHRQMKQAGARDFRELVRAAAAGSLAGVESLVDGGIPVQFCSSRLGTALTAALQNGHLEVVRFLLGNGVDPNRPAVMNPAASKEVYPIQLALRSEELLRLLVAVGADPGLRLPGPQGTPVVFAPTIPSPAAGRTLFSMPGIRQMKDFSGRGAVHCMDVESCRACAEFITPDDINALSGLGRSALYEAVCNEDIEKAEWLLDNGANPNQLCFCRVEPGSGRRCQILFSTPAHAALVGGLPKLAVAMAGAFLRLLKLPASCETGSPCFKAPRPPFAPATLSWAMPLFGWSRRRLAAKLAATGVIPSGARLGICGLPGDEILACIIHLALRNPELLDKILGRGAIWKWENPFTATSLAQSAATTAFRAERQAAMAPDLGRLGKHLMDISQLIENQADAESISSLPLHIESLRKYEELADEICGAIRRSADKFPDFSAALSQADASITPGFQEKMNELCWMLCVRGGELNKSFLDQDAWLASYDKCLELLAADLLEWSERIKKIAELCERVGNAPENPGRGMSP